MIDTFRPLKIVKSTTGYEDDNYMYTWIEK
jgi:homogentisate 1,2-dioxygenase